MPDFIVCQCLAFLLQDRPLCDKKKSKGVGHESLSTPPVLAVLLTEITCDFWIL